MVAFRAWRSRERGSRFRALSSVGVIAFQIRSSCLAPARPRFVFQVGQFDPGRDRDSVELGRPAEQFASVLDPGGSSRRADSASPWPPRPPSRVGPCRRRADQRRPGDRQDERRGGPPRRGASRNRGPRAGSAPARPRSRVPGPPRDPDPAGREQVDRHPQHRRPQPRGGDRPASPEREAEQTAPAQAAPRISQR